MQVAKSTRRFCFASLLSLAAIAALCGCEGPPLSTNPPAAYSPPAAAKPSAATIQLRRQRFAHGSGRCRGATADCPRRCRGRGICQVARNYSEVGRCRGDRRSF